MFETLKSSTLNPLANTFIPSHSVGTVPVESIAIRSTAEQKIRKIIKLEECGEKVLMNSELMNLVEELIARQYKLYNREDMLCIKSYLSAKIQSCVGLNSTVSGYRNCTRKSSTFDFSVFRPPGPTILLVAFLGLYRQEQAERPMLSLPDRPEILKDKIWSLTNQDLKLWNSCIQKCSCPSILGYTIPPSFLGNLFNLVYPCSVNSIHLNLCAETSEGNEYILTESSRNYPVDVEVFTDFEEKEDAKLDMEYYSEQLKAIVYSICSLIADLEDCVEADAGCTTEDDQGDDESDEACQNYLETLWDTDRTELKIPNADEVEEDDNNHPLLEAEYPSIAEGVSPEIQELIRRSLSDTSSESSDSEIPSNACDPPSLPVITASESSDSEIPGNACDPPCSVWCHSSTKRERADSLLSRSSDSSAIELLTETTDFLVQATGISLNSDGHRFQKPNFKRSFSANDCDPSYDQKYRLQGAMPRFNSSRETLSFLRKDPINFFKSLRNRNGSWKDSDSGIMTSQEDVFCETGSGESSDCNDSEEITPMWNLFSGEDSLWQPLPDTELPDQAKSAPHKRVRELKRQRSSVN